MKSRLLNLVVALVVAVLLGGAASFALTDLREDRYAEWLSSAPPEGTAQPSRDRVRNAVTELRKDGVHVPPDGRDMLDEAGEKRLEAAIAARPGDVPVRVIVWRKTTGAGSYLDTEEQLSAAFGDERSVILIWEGPEQGSQLLTGGEGYVSGPGTDATDFVGDPETALLAAVQNAEVRWYDNEVSDSDFWGGISGGIAAGLLFSAGALLLIFLFFYLVRVLTGGLLRLPGGWR